jgi:hypothetical protein
MMATKLTIYTVIFAWGLHGGVDVKSSGGLLFWSCIDVIVVKSAEECAILPNGDGKCGQ